MDTISLKTSREESNNLNLWNGGGGNLAE